MDIGHCQCERYFDKDAPCGAEPTQEDLLCDFCRTGRCSVIAFNGEWSGPHVIVDLVFPNITWNANAPK